MVARKSSNRPKPSTKVSTRRDKAAKAKAPKAGPADTTPEAVPEERSAQDILDLWRRSLPNQRLAHLVRVAARGYERGLQMRISDHGISHGQWTFLRILWQRDGLTQRELSVLAGLMEPTTHTAILRLEELGYVTRRYLPGNRKKRHIFLTDAGRALEAKLVPLAEMTNAVAVSDIPPGDIDITRRTLLKIIENLAEEESRAQDLGLRVASTRELGRRTNGNGKAKKSNAETDGQ
jgi:DNA-binding MarR family transcriptional regulator